MRSDAGGPPDDDDGGTPLPELADLGSTPSRDLEERVLRSIRRRESVAYGVGFAVGGLLDVFWAVVEWAGSLGKSDVSDEGEGADQ